jgi:type I restriction enzyme S subunit
MTLLKDIVQIEKGRKYNLLEENQQGAIRVFQANDFRNENKPLYTLDADGVLAQEDDIMLVWDGSVGQMGFGRSGYVGSTMVKLKVKNKNHFSPFFIYRFLQTKSEYLKRKATGATIMHINRKSLEQLEIPDFQLETQLHIAKLLSKAENLINQRKESIRLLDEFLKSTFLEMFGSLKDSKFPTCDLEKVSIKITDGTHNSPKFLSKGVPFLLVSNIVNNEINYETKKYISEEEYLILNKRTPVELGDILITSVGSYGNPAIVKTITKFAFQRHIAYIKPNHNKIDKTYLFGSLKSDFVKIQIEKVVRGVAQKTLNLAELRKLQIPIPPLELQTQFAQIEEKTEAIKTHYQQSLQELENLYGSLSQKAFRGELSLKAESLLMAAEPVTKYGE